jgi:hypothetical protein
MSDYLREIKSARIDSMRLTVDLSDGCTFAVPLSFYPTLQLATDDERNAMEILPYSLHWDALDCDLGIEGLLQDEGASQARGKGNAAAAPARRSLIAANG